MLRSGVTEGIDRNALERPTELQHSAAFNAKQDLTAERPSSFHVGYLLLAVCLAILLILFLVSICNGWFLAPVEGGEKGRAEVHTYTARYISAIRRRIGENLRVPEST